MLPKIEIEENLDTGLDLALLSAALMSVAGEQKEVNGMTRSHNTSLLFS